MINVKYNSLFSLFEVVGYRGDAKKVVLCLGVGIDYVTCKIQNKVEHRSIFATFFRKEIDRK